MKNLYLLVLSIFVFNQTFTADDGEKELKLEFTKTFYCMICEFSHFVNDCSAVLMQRQDTIQDLINRINERHDSQSKSDEYGAYHSHQISKLQIVCFTDISNKEIIDLDPKQTVVEAGIWDLDPSHKVLCLAESKKLTIDMVNGTKFEYEIDRDFRLMDLLPCLAEKIGTHSSNIKLFYKTKEINILHSPKNNGFWDDENPVLQCIVKAGK